MIGKFETGQLPGGRKGMSVVEQAKGIIGRFSNRHRHANNTVSGRHSTASATQTTSTSLVGRVESGLATCSRQAFDTETEAVGARFGRYYLEKIANLNPGDQSPK